MRKGPISAVAPTKVSIIVDNSRTVAGVGTPTPDFERLGLYRGRSTDPGHDWEIYPQKKA